MVIGLVVSGSAAAGVASCGLAGGGTSEPIVVDGGRSEIVGELGALVDRHGLPGAQVVVSDRGGSWVASAGVGDVEQRTPFPDEGRVRIGSNTKTFTATVILQLVAEGKVDLDAPVERYLPGVVRGQGFDGNRITIRNLLQHTSGLPEYGELIDPQLRANPLTQFDTGELVRRALALPAVFEPGAQWSYSNTNYLVAAMVIEQVTASTIDRQITSRIIEPLGLRATYYPARGETVLRDPHPSGYLLVDGKQTDITRLEVSGAGAAGAMVSTGADLNTFFTALLSGRLLPPAQLAEMKRTVTIDAPGPPLGYGLGLMHRELSCGKDTWGHGGDIDGFQTRGGVTADGRAVTVSVNQIPSDLDAIDEIITDIMKVVDTALCAAP
ncbi:serine hydrolase domain-containing protein [Nocardia yamanashiensis]|uniref:serine hydrolase domain-containing protein n=1 Tax=Nocardia yamanashiensis TaxID=209247 RepID=UPI001F44A6B7|nr:serine hydrolase domain-containing protein [Nocardia yamanashiensis]